MNEIFSGFSWHSSIGIDFALDGRRKFVTRIALPMSREAASQFEAAGDNLLVHKATSCLWKVSKDKKAIEPVFANDVLTEDDLKEGDE